MMGVFNNLVMFARRAVEVRNFEDAALLLRKCRLSGGNGDEQQTHCYERVTAAAQLLPPLTCREFAWPYL